MAITDFGKEISLHGTPYVRGEASGKLIASDMELSFWGGVSPRTSEIIDRHHPLNGERLEGSILAIPGGRGSCTGSTVILELILCDKAPKALVFERREDILTLGVIVAEEIFGKAIPVVTLDPNDFRELLKRNGRLIHVANGQVSTKPLLNAMTKALLGSHETEPTVSLNDMNLIELDKALLKGAYGDASRAAMRIVLRLANILGATELMDVTQVHVDGCGYTGPGSLAFAENLRDRGGKVRVPTSLNSISIDKNLRQVQGASQEFSIAAGKLADAYIDMGARPTFTCAPYQLDTAPKLGDQIAWAESNAVVYANSVLGARTMKYPDFLDISIALTGRAPNGGPHVQINRLASIIVRAPEIEKANVDDSFYPLLGYQVGNLATSQIPVVVGLESLRPTFDNLKAFGAAFATVSSAPMFHMVGVTPEAPTLEAALSKGTDVRSVDVHLGDLIESWDSLNSASNKQPIDLVSLGNPHFSLAEITKLASLCKGRTKDKNVAIMVTCGRVTYTSACKTGLTDELEAFGVQFITDTCWCMITEPTIPESQNAIITNSAKYAHYGPGLTGKSFYFGSLARCVEAACGSDYLERRPQLFDSRLQYFTRK
ncbi:hypothetical protein N7462_008216 [Penicillium macrosclerotiorum]|uniref:uncharacterized protein n=1 Tax=Penicillium macrosclerotiorum TaxID=303699 RepID=UPI00254803A8|nr:uncharacterized protein N7462_008216 [Penicillium macrosclerotiorum]KAJ5679972.1 hypothetical protein N7462_008216 [Penicillium macrosclerotiorum]